MRREPFPKCCGICGRWGNRGYTWDGVREEWLCRNETACQRRAHTDEAGGV